MQISRFPDVDSDRADALESVPFDLLRALVAEQRRATPTVLALARRAAGLHPPRARLTMGRDVRSGSFLPPKSATVTGTSCQAEATVNYRASTPVDAPAATTDVDPALHEDAATRLPRTL